MKTYRVTLTPASSMDELPASDRLFGALCWGIRAVYCEKKLLDALNEFDKNKPLFILSSSFPVLESERKRVYFYPMLRLPGPGMGYMKETASRCSQSGLAFKIALTRAVEDWKRFRSAGFASRTITAGFLTDGSLTCAFEKFHSGRTQTSEGIWSPLRLGGEVKLVSGDLLMSQDEYMDIFHGEKPVRLQVKATIQKNRLDRLLSSTGGAGELYYTSDIRFTSDPGGPKLMLHFLLKTCDIAFLKPVLKWLADTGIGGNRTTGRNQFAISEPEEAEVPEADGGVFFTLSRYLPEEDDVPFMYDLLPRRHRLESSYFRGADIWKKKIIYFREGSCFRCQERKEYYGGTEEVKRVGDNRIRQNGIAFPIFGSAP